MISNSLAFDHFLGKLDAFGLKPLLHPFLGPAFDRQRLTMKAMV